MRISGFPYPNISHLNMPIVCLNHRHHPILHTLPPQVAVLMVLQGAHLKGVGVDLHFRFKQQVIYLQHAHILYAI